MQGNPIEELNVGLSLYSSELNADSLAAKRVEVAIVTFGPVAVAVDFTTAQQFHPPQLEADGSTPLGEAIGKALDMVAARKQVYKDNGIAFYRPWIFLITDGAPTDSWHEAAERIKEGERKKSFAFFSVGVEGADFSVLRQLSSVREPLKLKGLRFRDLFQWLSNSQQSVSRSQPDESVPLEDPVKTGGWATVDA
jgi:uncharacterized protein YegL